MATGFSKSLHRLSAQFLIPQQLISPKAEDRLCMSKNLLLANAWIYQCAPGTYALLPHAVRSLEKLTKLIDREMQSIDAQKVILPNVVDASLIRKSGRWDLMEKDLFKLTDRHKQQLCLAPTHEEVVTTLVGSFKLSLKHLPIKLYQVTMKYRDEKNPRYGLLRCREFLMKDLYTFDADEPSAARTYEQVCGAYDRLFTKLGVRVLKARGDSGAMGGSLSHEFHLAAACGEDRVRLCKACNSAVNVELDDSSSSPSDACVCVCGKPTESIAAIEVGHCFRLGTRYSAQLNARFVDGEQQLRPLAMGCYGIGVTRLLAAILEQSGVNAHPAKNAKDASDLRLPANIAPYRICVVTPKAGSKEQLLQPQLDALLYTTFGSCAPAALDDVVLDDRDTETIGMRVRDARRLGVPTVIVIGKKTRESLPPDEADSAAFGRTLVEVIDVLTNKSTVISLEQLRASLPQLLF